MKTLLPLVHVAFVVLFGTGLAACSGSGRATGPEAGSPPAGDSGGAEKPPKADAGPPDTGALDGSSRVRRDAGGSDASVPGAEAAAADAGSGASPDASSGTDAHIASDPTGTQAARASKLLGGVGVNTHIDFPGYQAIGLPAIEKAIAYVGNGALKVLRDSPSNDADLTSWPAVAKATGVKFDAFIQEGAPSVYQDNLARMEKMVDSGEGYILAFEGGNEEDDTYPIGLGNSQQQAAAFQPMVWSAGQAKGVPVFQISFGAGWSMPTGDYGTVGDLSASATFGNAHTYPQVNPKGDIASLDSDALLTTPAKPVAHTEFGWNSFSSGSNGGYGWASEATCAAYDVSFILDSFNAGNPYYFRYELFDDDQLESANSWGLFYDSGTPKQSATAIRVLFQLLGDSGASADSFAPGKLDYTLTGLPAATSATGADTALFQKSDGSFWLAVWNEQVLNDTSHANADIAVAPVAATLTLTTPATSVAVYDLLAQSTTPLQQATSVTSLALRVPAHPILVKIVRP